MMQGLGPEHLGQLPEKHLITLLLYPLHSIEAHFARCPSLYVSWLRESLRILPSQSLTLLIKGGFAEKITAGIMLFNASSSK